VTINSEEAGAILADVETIAGKVKRSRQYRLAGAATILWGAITLIVQLLCLAAPKATGWIWLIADIGGVIATIVILRRGLSNRAGANFATRFLIAYVLFFVFGYAWSEILGRFGVREHEAFWPTFFLFGYSLAGLWFGAAYLTMVVGLAALVLAGYLWAGDWFQLWLALVDGGGMVLFGLWMRRS
jgi:hypothetical protein